MNGSHISIVNPVPDTDDEWRGASDALKVMLLPVDTIAKNTKEFLDQLGVILSQVETKLSGFELEEIEVSAALTTSGKLSLLSIGEGGLSTEGGIKFVFKQEV